MSKKVNERMIAISPRQSLIKRMNVYFGDELGDESNPYSSQKSVLVREIPDNSVDILRKLGKGGTVRVTFFEDKSIEVYDSGSGIPIELSKTHDGIPASSLYLSLGVLNAGTNYEKASDSIGTNGVGGSGAQMLSEYMKVEVYRDKKIYRLDFQEGKHGIFDDNGNFKPAKDLTFLDVKKDNRPTDEKKKFPTGTKIKFKIDDTLFKSDYGYEIAYLVDIMRGMSFLDGSIKFEIYDYQNKQEDNSPTTYFFNYGGGLSHIVDLKLSSKLTPVYTVMGSSVYKDKTVDITGKKTKVVNIEKEIRVEAAFAYNNDYTYEVESFVNTLKTRKNGVHVKAFEDSLLQVFNSKLQSMRGYLSKSEKNLPTIDDYIEGLRLAVAVNVPEPEFTHQTKESLGGKATYKTLKKLFIESLENWVNDRKNQNEIKIIADKVIAAYKIRTKKTEELALKREKNKIERTSRMPVKLVDCEITHSPLSEIFICEGDSALSGLLSARYSSRQALLPVRGKVLNVIKANPKDILSNKEIQDIIKCVDAGIGKDFEESKMRYGKIVLAVDQDPDGENIANLLITLFWTLMPEVITKGHLYKVLTPLYIIKTAKEVYYCLDAEEKEKVVSKLKNTKYTITRAKGLGESGQQALRDTAMNPQTRRILKITVDDIDKSKEMLEIVMGTDVGIRRQWIENNPYTGEENASEEDLV